MTKEIKKLVRSPKKNRQVFFGTYDLDMPRVRILKSAFGVQGYEVCEIHYNLWKGIKDKSQIKGILKKMLLCFKLFLNYPILIIKFMTFPSLKTIVIPYMGVLDVLIIWPFARLRGCRIIWDIFISTYDTVVNDRKLLSQKNIISRLIYFLEYIALRLVDRAVIDTQAHAQYLEKVFHLEDKSIKRVFVGVEKSFFCKGKTRDDTMLPFRKEHFNILFYGNYIPLHGIDVILKAAKIFENEDIFSHVRWFLIGDGQEKLKMLEVSKQLDLSTVHFVDPVKYDELKHYIQGASLCLGIFGTSSKAKSVIPNKVFQILSLGCPLVTMKTSAIAELGDIDENLMGLSIPGSPKSLYLEVVRFIEKSSNGKEKVISPVLFDEHFVSRQLSLELGDLI